MNHAGIYIRIKIRIEIVEKRNDNHHHHEGKSCKHVEYALEMVEDGKKSIEKKAVNSSEKENTLQQLNDVFELLRPRVVVIEKKCKEDRFVRAGYVK